MTSPQTGPTLLAAREALAELARALCKHPVVCDWAWRKAHDAAPVVAAACQAQAERVLAVCDEYAIPPEDITHAAYSPWMAAATSMTDALRAALAVPSGPATEPTQEPITFEARPERVRRYTVAAEPTQKEIQDDHAAEPGRHMEPGDATADAGLEGQVRGKVAPSRDDATGEFAGEMGRARAGVAEPTQAARDRAAIERVEALLGEYGFRPLPSVARDLCRDAAAALAGESDQPEDGAR